MNQALRAICQQILGDKARGVCALAHIGAPLHALDAWQGGAGGETKWPQLIRLRPLVLSNYGEKASADIRWIRIRNDESRMPLRR